MNVAVAYNGGQKKYWIKLNVGDECTVLQAINQSGLLMKCPEIDLESNKLGIYGKIVKLDAKLQEGDRVEIYRAITADPKTVPRRDMDDDDEDDD